MTLAIHGVTVDFGSTRAVDDVSLTVARGSIFALIGPSGCGKSTLLRAIAGLITPTAGSLSWDSQDLTSVPVERRDIGLMFQDHALFTHRSVADNVGFGLRMRKVPAAERHSRVQELLALVGLSGFGDRSVERLSGGEAQRVALARALAPRPRLLLLDEPLASLDRARRDELNDELVRLLRQLDQTAVYVTHDQHEAFAVADAVGVMHAGSLVTVGPAADVWRDPQTELVARFVGHDPIIERGGRRFAVRADALALTEHANATARAVRVQDCRFQGDRYRVEVCDTDDQHWAVWSDRPYAIGASVGLLIDESRLARLLD